MIIEIRPLNAGDAVDAERIFRLAFGTFLGLPDPITFMGDASLVTPRWRTAPEATLGAFHDNELVGSNFISQWGSFGFFGPLTVLPQLWGNGIAKQLIAHTMDQFNQWRTRHIALFTFPHSPMHLALYQKFGFWPHYLTVVLTHTPELHPPEVPWTRWSALSEVERKTWATRCRALTQTIYPGLDIQSEIDAVNAQNLGDTILLPEDDRLDSFAICHIGANTEAGSDTAYVKFGAAQPGVGAPQRFEKLLRAIDALAHACGAGHVLAGANTARCKAYGLMLKHGFRAAIIGIAMHRPNKPGYNRPDCFVIDDLR